jgi:hypothetical protein
MCFLAKRDTIYVINPTLPDCLFLVDLSFLYQAQLIFFLILFLKKKELIVSSGFPTGSNGKLDER